jgi:hypothetical protein
MPNNDIAFFETPKNSNGIKRSRTSKQVRSWEMTRSTKTLESFNKELGSSEYPGIYVLFERQKKVYIGEAKNIYKRLKQHNQRPDDRIGNWDRLIVINDGRPATQSDFNDTVVRKALEYYLIALFETNKYTVVSHGESQTYNPQQRYLVNSLVNELNFFLLRKNIIDKIIEEPGQEEVFDDDLKRIFVNRGKRITQWAKYEAVIDGEKVFIRPGSKKRTGWQITSRGRKPGSFIDSLQKGKGYLLIARNGVPFVPLETVQKVITDPKSYEQDTIDIWINFTEDKITLRYRNNTIDITDCRLLK